MTGTKKREYVKTEREYRKIKGLNQSMLKTFDSDPMKFYREFILGEPRDDDDSWATGVGSLFDFYVLECHSDEQEFEQNLDDKFGRLSVIRTTAQAFDLADVLLESTKRDMDENGTVNGSFEDRFKEAFLVVQGWGKYKKKTWEQGLEDFNTTGKTYFEEKLENIGKTVVDSTQIEKARQIVGQLKEDEFHSKYAFPNVGKDQELHNKLVVEWTYRGIECKAEIDRAIINHKTRRLKRIDYKATFDNEEQGFEYSYLVKRKYYLQNAFYHLAAKAFLEQNGWEDYLVEPMEFLVTDTSKNNRRPLLYITSSKHVLDGLNGFTDDKGRYHKGVEELITDILWAQDNGIWTISRENYSNGGIVKLKEFSL